MVRQGFGLALALVMAGCGDVAYQMGSGGDQFHKDQHTCANGDESAYKSCMRARGWTVVDLDSLRIVPSAPGRDPAAPPTTTPPGSMGSSPATNIVAPTPAADPNATVTVNSWWKFGATDFRGDAKACTDKLGEAHRYDEVKKTTTRAFALCLRERGWYAY